MLVPKVLADDKFNISDITNTSWYKDVFGDFKFGDPNATIGDIFSALLPFIFAMAGLMLFGAIIYSGFLYLTSGGEPKKNEEAKGCLTSSVVGFLIIFLAWWVMRILEIVFHLEILGGTP